MSPFSLQSSTYIQESAKEWTLSCVKRAAAARGSQDTGITQPMDHSLADPCTRLRRIEIQSRSSLDRGNFWLAIDGGEPVFWYLVHKRH